MTVMDYKNNIMFINNSHVILNDYLIKMVNFLFSHWFSIGHMLLPELFPFMTFSFSFSSAPLSIFASSSSGI